MKLTRTKPKRRVRPVEKLQVTCRQAGFALMLLMLPEGELLVEFDDLTLAWSELLPHSVQETFSYEVPADQEINPPPVDDYKASGRHISTYWQHLPPNWFS